MLQNNLGNVDEKIFDESQRIQNNFEAMKEQLQNEFNNKLCVMSYVGNGEK